MPIQQSFNPKIQAFVKFKFVEGGRSKILDVKQREPLVPFKGTPIVRKKK